MKHFLFCLVSCFLWICCASQSVCEEPPDIEFGEVVSGEKVSYQEHDRIQYRCSPGYTLEGSEWIICNDLKWTLPPKCLAPCIITRQQLDAENLLISNGRRRSQLIWSNHSIAFMCREGYVIRTPSVRKCVDGHMDFPSCISERGKTCSSSPIIQNGDIITPLQKQYPSGSWVEFKCQPYHAMEGLNKSFCDNGNWTEVPACLDKTCQEHPAVDNADVLRGAGGPFLPGHQVQYQCQEGFVMSGPDTITCENKTWSKPPVCKDETCPRPPTIPHGRLDGQQKERYLPFEKVRYRCEARWSLFGPQTVTCVNRQWTALPDCREAEGRCDRPPVIQNGDILEAIELTYETNSIVTYKCQAFYIMHGQPTVLCLNGHWTEAPECIEPCTASEEDMRNHNIQFRWTSDGKLYSKSGDVMEFECRNGFHPSPSSHPFRVPCIEGKLEYPSCTKVCTVNARAMGNRNIQLKQPSATIIPFGDEVEFICKPGFQAASPSSSFHVQCGEGNFEYPRCRRAYVPIYPQYQQLPHMLEEMAE